MVSQRYVQGVATLLGLGEGAALMASTEEWNRDDARETEDEKRTHRYGVGGMHGRDNCEPGTVKASFQQ
jgi:hypothetical protein